MTMIYALDDEGGGKILSDSDTLAPALQVNSNAAGYPAIACYSTASGSVIKATALDGPAFDGDSETASYPAGDFRSAATTGPAVIIGRTVTGSHTIAPLKILNPSAASAAVMEFTGGFISCTSVDFTATAETDYMLVVSVNGVQRGIPLMQLGAVQGGAAFA